MVLLVRGLLSLANLYYQNRFAAHMQEALSSRMLKSYLRQPFQATLSSNSAILSKHLLVEVASSVSCIKQALILVTEGIVATALVLMISYIDPGLISWVAIVTAVAMFALIKLTSKWLLSMGREVTQCNADMYKAVSQALHGVRDIKVFRAEKFFLAEFRRPLLRSCVLSVAFELVSGVPGLVMNLLAFSSLLVVMLYLLFTQGDLLSALPLIAVIAFAVQRLLPSVSKIHSAIAIMRKRQPGVHIIRKTLQDVDEISVRVGTESEAPPPMRFEKVLRLENVSYTYPGAARRALGGVSLEIPRNTALGIIGSSGAGKSTLVNVLLGLLPVSEGRILCDKIELTDDNRAAFAQLVAYVPQETFLLDDTLRANVAFGIPEHEIDEALVQRAIEVAQLGPLVAELPEGLESHVGERGARVSGGQRQRVGIARALYREPQILILDEATAALDTATETEFSNAIRQLMGKKTLIVIAHRLSSLDLCDRLVLIREGGRVETEGTIDELSRSSYEFRRLYAIPPPPVHPLLPPSPTP